MPGLTFIGDSEGGLVSKAAQFDAALNRLIRTSSYSNKILARSDKYILAATAYPEYPIELLDLGDYAVAVEGRLQGPGETKQDKIRRLVAILSEPRDSAGDLRNWLLETDGEFLIFIHDKRSDEWLFLCDALGRLPCYLYNQNGTMIISREFCLITHLLERHEYDRMALAEFILFGYSLGNRTFLKGIQRLTPAFLLRYDKHGSSLTSLHTFNFEKKEYADQSIDENAAQLAKTFRYSCAHRSEGSPFNVVSLSGGLDSRIVACGLQGTGVQFVAATFAKKASSRESELAGDLAEHCNWTWERYLLNPPTGKETLELLKLKCGLNYLGMNFIIPFLHDLVARLGQGLTYFTGDGGDKVLPDLRPAFRLGDVEELTDAVINSQQTCRVELAASLTRIDQNDIRRELESILRGYPEQDLSQKFVHFLIYERAMRLMFEGEDRNRFFFWSTAPAYGIHFFNYAMNCPDEQKNRYRLYRKLLMNLSGSAAQIPELKTRVSPASKWFGILKQARMILDQRMPTGVKNRIRGNGSYEHSSPIIQCLGYQVANSGDILTNLSSNRLQDMIARSEKYAKGDITGVFTVTSFIELAEKNHSSIESYSQTQFD